MRRRVRSIPRPRRGGRKIGLALLAGLCLILAPWPAAAQDRALLVVLDAYADPRLAAASAGTAAQDIAALQGLLTGQFGYAAEQIKVLRDDQATGAAILDAIATWLAPAPPQAKVEAQRVRKGKRKRRRSARARRHAHPKLQAHRLLLYFAGYGALDLATGRPAILPYDATVSGGSDAARITGMISADAFSAALKKLDGHDVTVLLDTSHGPAEGRLSTASRAPAIAVARPKPIHGRGEGRFITTAFSSGTLTVWAAAASGQTALIDTAGVAPRGLFTRLYVEGLANAKADRNHNDVVSNMELLRYLREGSKAYCDANPGRCDLGLTPILYPRAAFARAVLPNDRRPWRRLSLDAVRDMLAAETGYDVRIEQLPPSPVHVGARNIRFRVTSLYDGTLILLNLTDRGRLMQLYPNRYKRSRQGPGRVLAKTPVTVPDIGYRLTLNATDPVSGHIIALVTRDPVDFGKNVFARNIGDIPPGEAVSYYLPRLAATLAAPLRPAPGVPTDRLADWSLTTLRYEILP